MNVRVVLVGIEGAVNLGVIIRTCKNFEVEEIYLVKPVASLEEASRYVAKADDYLRNKVCVVGELSEAIKDVDLVVATSAKGYSLGDILRQAISIQDFLETIKGRNTRLAILFGRESTGLTRDELEKADILVTIPASPEYPVLNVSQAVSIFLWELWKLYGREASNIPPRASRDEINELINIIRSITGLAFTSKDKLDKLVFTWRRVIYRSNPSKYEVRLLTYWSRRVYNRLKKQYS
ncbi:MAG: RNA methyltransferase [Desulfurococcales archaeon ex4484_58]|nr:MAG: RNA methyltransferase [Desulfurococcales archaeon ex4484_58]